MAKKKSTKKKPAAKKAKSSSSGSRSAYIAKAPIRRLMKNEGAQLVAEDAVEMLIEKLTSVAKSITKEAVKVVKGDKRKRVTAADIIAVE